jgi:hypothetical protein
MQDSAQYRREAQKFAEQAQHAKSELHRISLFRKAEMMVRLAKQAELMQQIIEHEDLITPRSA